MKRLARMTVVGWFVLLGCGGGGGTPAVSGRDQAPQDTSGIDTSEAEPQSDAFMEDAAADPGQDVQPACVTESDCDDKNPCTIDACVSGQCENTPVTDGAPCDDGDPCTEGDTCKAGACTSGIFTCQCKENADCQASQNPCMDVVCNLDTHTCEEVPKPNDTPCDDQNDCTEGETCQDGKCTGGTDICPCESDPECPPPENDCQVVYCDLQSHTCKTADRADGTPCSDGNPCTLGDVCDSGICKSGQPKDCDDKDDCTKDYCDLQTGQCKNEFVPQFGCCETDAQCDDNDPCTIEKCVKHRCERQGEPAGVTGYGCATVQGCAVGFCSEQTGGCRQLSADAPAVLFDWDLTAGVLPQGMRWTTDSGQLGPQGAGPKPTAQLASFVFPEHWVPAGIYVLHLALQPGSDCAIKDKVTLKVGQAPEVFASGCAMEEDRAVVGFHFEWSVRAQLGLEVTVKQQAFVSRATLYLFGVGSCKPLQPVRAVLGTGLSNLSSAASRTEVALGYRYLNTTLKLSRYSLWDAVKKTKDVSQSTQSNETTSLLMLPDGRFLFAFDGVIGFGPSRVNVYLLDADGTKIAQCSPNAAHPQVQQLEPFLLRNDKNIFLVYSSTDADQDGLGIMYTRVIVSGASVSCFTPSWVNDSVSGDQYAPVITWIGSWGVVGWRHKIVQSEQEEFGVRLHKVSETQPIAGEDFKVASANDAIRSISLLPFPKDNWLFVAATTEAGQLLAYRVNADLSSTPPPQAFYDVPPGKWYDANLVPGDGLLYLVATRVYAGNTSVVQVRVNTSGKMENPVALSGDVGYLDSRPTVTQFSPFMHLVAFIDSASAGPGARFRPFSTRCESGPVRCSANVSEVCTGLGSGYIVFTWANEWCK